MPFFIPKRDGVLSISLLVIVLAAVLGYAYWGSWREPPAGGERPLPALPAIQVPDDAAVKEMATLSKRLNRLAYPHPHTSQRVELGLFGYTPATFGLHRNDGAGAGASPPVQFDYTLSFALSAGKKQLCMLDGQLFTLGAVLPDGGRILAIEPERVLIEKAPLKQWIYLQEPRIGGEAPAAAHTLEPSKHKDL